MRLAALKSSAFDRWPLDGGIVGRSRRSALRIGPPPTSCYGVGASWGLARAAERADVETGSNADDAKLVAAAAIGDRNALAQLYDRFAPILLAVATRILRERREAEDLLHDVFLEVWRQAGDYDEKRGSVRAWLLVRLRSRALDRRKSAAATRFVSGDAERILDEREGGGGDDPSLAPDRTKVRKVIATLPDEQRTVLELGYFEGLSSSEIAARIDAPIGTVKSRVAAALARLRAGLAG
jgi:RNA polymerase sigma-70 factor (ECF subfamily)